MECDPVGTVHTPYDTTSDAPRQGFREDAEGVVGRRPDYREGLLGFDGDRVVVWWADRADRSVVTLDRDPACGVFTTRSPARPPAPTPSASRSVGCWPSTTRPVASVSSASTWPTAVR